MIFPAPMRWECAVLACSGVMVPETNLKLLAQTSWWIPLPISPVRASRWAMGRNPQGRAATFNQAPRVSGLRGQTDIVHEQRVNARLAECDDRVGGRADDWLAVIEGRIDDERHAGSRKETGYELVKARTRFASHELQPGAAVMVQDGRDAITPLGLDPTCEQHEFVTRRVGANLEPFVGAFGQDARCKRPEVLTVLDHLIEDVAHVRSARVGEERSVAEGARPELHAALKPGDDLAISHHVRGVAGRGFAAPGRETGRLDRRQNL